MNQLQLCAQPWWVNLLFLIPVLFYTRVRRLGILISASQLLWMAIFGSAFGFVEASVVVYLRAAIGLLPGYTGTLQDLRASSLGYQQSLSIVHFPQSLLTIEMFREAATMIMLIGVAMLTCTRRTERFAAFLWVFAFWDLTYYLGLWATVRWPASLLDIDVLFLLPVPWFAQVWFPVLVSTLTVIAVLLSQSRQKTTG
jgi:hypothetical protein